MLGCREESASSAYSEEPSGQNISLVASPAHCKCLLPFLFISLAEWKKLPSRLETIEKCVELSCCALISAVMYVKL